MVWGAIAGWRKSRLVIIDGENNKGQGFINTVYKQELIRFMEEVKDGILMEDNAPVHNSTRSTSWKMENGIKRLCWPACSPDLNPIEHIWSILKQYLNQRPRKPTSKDEMITAILEEWERITPQTIIDLISSMNKE
jgi:transposase